MFRANRLNGLGSPFGFETVCLIGFLAALLGLNGLGSPFGFETPIDKDMPEGMTGLNGLWSPFGIETCKVTTVALLFEDGGLSQSRKLSY